MFVMKRFYNRTLHIPYMVCAIFLYHKNMRTKTPFAFGLFCVIINTIGFSRELPSR